MRIVPSSSITKINPPATDGAIGWDPRWHFTGPSLIG
jgi:hypothetical protein